MNMTFPAKVDISDLKPLVEVRSGLRPIVATMIGDPGGIGPEVTVKALASGEAQRVGRPLLVGSVSAVLQAIKTNRLKLDARQIHSVGEARFDPEVVDVLDDDMLAPEDLVIGRPTAVAGRAVRAWIDTCTRLAEGGEIHAWIMAPVDRTSLELGIGADYGTLEPHNTFLLRTNGRLRVVPLSEHLPLRDVPATVTRERVQCLVDLVDRTLKRWGIPQPRIAVAGLNPHARGEEERTQILPAVEYARNAGTLVTGPISPDSVFRQCIEGAYDVVVSMYHDQGQIALKTAAFEGACSTYLGLPYIHLTVPHGSAMDIAGQGIAQHASMLAAMKTATAMASGNFSL